MIKREDKKSTGPREKNKRHYENHKKLIVASTLHKEVPNRLTCTIACKMLHCYCYLGLSLHRIFCHIEESSCHVFLFTLKKSNCTIQRKTTDNNVALVMTTTKINLRCFILFPRHMS